MRPSVLRLAALLLVTAVALAPLSSGKSTRRDPSELVVHFAEFNGTLQEGSSNGVYASIENRAAPTASGFVVRFEIDGVLLGDVAMPAGFTGFGSPNAPQRWTATAGTHTLRVTADATGAVRETDESNNVFTWTFEVQPGPPGGPDLLIQNGGFVDPVDQAGQSSKAWVVVENAGAATQADSVLAFEVDGASLGTATVPAGYAGVQAFQSPQAWTATAGTHTLRITVDASDALAESDESNNVFTHTFTVQGGGPGVSELRVQYGAWNGTAWEGLPIKAYASIENNGAPTAQAFAVSFHVDGLSLGDGSMPAGFTGIGTTSSQREWTPTPGTHVLRVEVDPYGEVGELDETDNVFTWTFEVEETGSLAELSVLGVKFNQPVEEGRWSDAWALVENHGAPTTNEVAVAFWVDSTSLGQATIPAGFRGQAEVTSPQGWVATEGGHRLRVVVDPEWVEPEGEEFDNEVWYDFEVADSLDTDLRVTEAMFNGSFSDGSTGRFGIYVENWGDPTPVDTIVHFQVDSTWLGNVMLPAGFQGRTILQAPDLWTATPGLHVFYGTADAGGQLSEPNEGDNTYTWYFSVDGLPPPERETIFLWGTPYGPSVPDVTVETADVFLGTGYQTVLYDLRCFGATVQVFLDGELVASCAENVRVERYVDVMGGGGHTFTLVYAGFGYASLEVSGIPMIY